MYELCYTNTLAMLDLSGNSIKTKDRTIDDPLIIAGGTCTVNPEPIADFIDLFVIGDGEEIIFEIIEKYMSLKGTGLSREKILFELAQIQGIYVPSLYDTYQDPKTGMVLARKTCRASISCTTQNFDGPESISIPYKADYSVYRNCF